MNRAVQKLHQRRCALKNSSYFGGGLDINPQQAFLSENGVPYAENQFYTECVPQGRPGALDTPANPDLAQVAMAGGHRQGCGLMRGGGCGCNMRSRRMRGGQCGGPQRAWLGGKRTYRKHRSMRGGNKGGFGLDVSMNVGGEGPIAEPARMATPCDPRAGMVNPFTATPTSPDPRAPAFGYSLTANMAGGGDDMAYALTERIPNFEYAQTMMGGGYGGNAYDASCYRAPGSEMPVYPATSAGFHFTPSTEAGATLPDGITAFNEVVANTARLGGAYSKRRKHSTYRKKAKKARKSRRQSRRQ